jgi:hypothetical protein
MPKGTGVATISFPASPQAAQSRLEVITTDSVPSNVDWIAPAAGLPAGASNAWRSVAFGAGVWVALTFSNNAARSTDGITWTALTLPLTRIWIGVTYGNGVFVAVSTTGTPIVSSDGSVWNTYSMAESALNGLGFGAGKFVAIPSNTSTAGNYSTDGQTWTSSTLPSLSVWTAPVYGNGGFITLQGSTSQKSSDGATWASGGSLPASGSWNTAFGDSTYVGLTATTAIYSKDGGVTWQLGVITVVLGGSLTSVAYGDGRFVATTDTSGLISSFDGITWVAYVRPPLLGADQPTRIVYANETYMLTCNGSNAFAYLKRNTRTVSTTSREISAAKSNPGTNTATTTITGISAFSSTGYASAQIVGYDSTSDFNSYEHSITDIKLTCDNFVDNSGFDITAISPTRLEGDIKVRYAWST